MLEAHALDGFDFGAEYALKFFANLADKYSSQEVGWTKWNGEFEWGAIEPDPPDGGAHAYKFLLLDIAVSKWQQGGFRDMTVVLRAANDWGGEPLQFPAAGNLALSERASTPPKDDQHWGYYADFVRAVVERYDGDGVRDAVNLKFPIHNWEIETEAQHDVLWQAHCPGCTEEEYRTRRIEQYLKLLRVASAAVRQADPRAQVIATGMMFLDLFDRGPLSAAEVSAKLQTEEGQLYKLPEAMRFNAAVLEATDAYDAAELHLLTHYTGIEGTVRWMKQAMGPSSATKKVFVGDSASGPTVVHVGPIFLKDPEYPDGIKLLEVLETGTDLYGYTYAEVDTWLRAEQARFTAKAILTAIGSGGSGINLFGWLDDHNLFKHPNIAVHTWGIQGLRDGKISGLTMEVGEPRPALNILWFLAQKLSGVSKVERIDAGPQVRAYRLTVGARELWAAWLDRLARQVREPAPVERITLPLREGSWQLSLLPYTRGAGVQTRRLGADCSGLSLELSDMPVLIEPL